MCLYHRVIQSDAVLWLSSLQRYEPNKLLRKPLRPSYFVKASEDGSLRSPLKPLAWHPVYLTIHSRLAGALQKTLMKRLALSKGKRNMIPLPFLFIKEAVPSMGAGVRLLLKRCNVLEYL